MEKLFNIINMGYLTNLQEVKVPFKKKYVLVLQKLLQLNCIDFYTFSQKSIKIKLRYFHNKPLFFFLIQSRGGNKIYKNFFSEKKNIKFTSNISLAFTDKGLLTTEECFYKNSGGEFIVDILFLNKK